MSKAEMIPEFYEDCDIFITGGSGVVGKAIIEKLLRSCNVKRIYILLRGKKDLGFKQRLEKIKSAKIFRVLRATKPEELDKIIPIPGDATLPNLGITAESAKLMENVSIVFHCAATVRFDEPLKFALNLNVGGTLEALKFAETLKNLKIFMHVSTFFSNPYLHYVEPKVYSSPMDWKVCLEIVNKEYNDDMVDVLTRKLITGFPNTYTFTKNLAETLVNDFRGRLPVAIYRPSIVLFAVSEPEPYFPPTLMGALGLFALVGAGILKTVYMDPENHLDLSPQDFVTKSVLYYTQQAELAYREGNLTDVPVYMTSSRTHLKQTFYDTCQLIENKKLWLESPFEKNFLIPGCHYTGSRLVYMFLVFTKQIFPCMLGDLLLRLFRQKPVLMSIMRKGFLTLKVMDPFRFNNYMSPGMTDYEGLRELRGTPFDVVTDVENIVTTEEGMKTLCTRMAYKIREILLNEDPKTIERARRVMEIKQIVYNIVRALLAYYMLRGFYRVFMAYLAME